MFKSNLIFFILILFLITSCETMKEVKRGLTGEKKNSTDEFMVKKKDPLILPPDYENLPSPDERKVAQENVKSFEQTLKGLSSTVESSDTSESTTTEKSILKKIQNN
tara:strand:+ start:1233 stop:1553 length:321 start_codon:yes stop_codon:yes gene_type:complete